MMKMEESTMFCKHAVDIFVNKKGKILAKTVNVCVEHTHCKSHDSFVELNRENDQKRRKPKKKFPGFT